ncbi:hypothetical protein BBG47_09135 [Paenibacillus sp. KS1]|uniref:hypothetical protein n=1 Tax=Paenibacillus sp. KS1 TaxID=1849249 RepID=UPI0008067229|nr:hypothetical protein [Paenibacillus sp. KS1]OBY79902.1 hypothetical protein BBG47_09135 [Paenibacillus sp. KS1]
MSKKLTSLFFSLVLIFSLASSAFAEEGKNVLTFDQKEQLKAIEEKYDGDVEIFFPDSESLNSTDSSERMKFNSVEELEAFIDILKSEQTNEDFNTLGSSPLYTGHVKWYAALLGGTFSWKNIEYKYDVSFDKKGNGYMSRIYDVSSYLTGIQIGLSYTQLKDRSWVSGDTAHLIVDGTYLVGADIFGVPIGVKVETTWEKTDTKDMPSQA